MLHAPLLLPAPAPPKAPPAARGCLPPRAAERFPPVSSEVVRAAGAVSGAVLAFH